MQRNVISRVDVLLYFSFAELYRTQSTFQKIIYADMLSVCQAELNLIIHTTYLCDVTKSICAVSILHLGIVCILL